MPDIEFYNFLSEKFKLDNKFADKADFFFHFKKFLLKAYSENKLVFVIIDAAQTLIHDRFEEIRLLSNIEFENQKLLNIFFVGQNEIETILMDPRNKATSQRINMSYQLQPLDENETIHYIAHRLKVAGAKRGIFTDDACKKIFDIADGIPRLINSICDCALLSGYVKGLKIIDPILIRECQIELSIPIGTRYLISDVFPVPTSPVNSKNPSRFNMPYLRNDTAFLCFSPNQRKLGSGFVLKGNFFSS